MTSAAPAEPGPPDSEGASRTDAATRERPAPPSGGGRGWIVRAGGAAVAIWGALLLAVYGAFLTPFRIGAVLVPISVAIAIGGNAVLAWFAYRVTGNRFLGLLPGLVWIVLSLVWADRTTEGDLVLTSSWVSGLYLLLGASPTVVAAYRWFLAPPPSRRP